MNQREFNKLKKSAFEIMFGFSSCFYKGKEVYLKHFNFRDQLSIDISYEDYYVKGLKDGLPNEESRLKDLEQSQEWQKSDEEDLNRIKLFISDLRANKSNLFIKSQIDIINKEIEDKEKEYDQKLKNKLELISITAESYANRRLNNDYIRNSFFKDSSLKDKLFTEEVFQDCDNNDISELISLYNRVSDSFDEKNIKRIGVSPFFQNSFSLCEDDAFKFFGKYIIELTYYQQSLFTYGRYFKHILSEHKSIPLELFDDPDKLVDFVVKGKNMKDLLAQNDGQGSLGIAGATKEDLKEMGVNGISLNEMAKKKGGNLTMADLLAMEAQL